jgi:hypothetical protein
VGNDGHAYFLRNGNLYRAGITTSVHIRGGVRKIVQGDNGHLWVDLGGDGLRLYDPAKSTWHSPGTLQDAPAKGDTRYKMVAGCGPENERRGMNPP